MTVKTELERALRTRGWNDGYAGRPKAFPQERSYLDSYQHGVEAKAKDAGQGHDRQGRAAAAQAAAPDDRPLAPPPPIPSRP